MNKIQKSLLSLFIALILIFVVIKFLPAYYYKKGVNFYNNKNYTQSYLYLKKALAFNHTNHDYRYYYIQSLSHLSPNLKVQKEVFNISVDSLNDSAQEVAINKIDEWRYNITRNIGNNYIEQVPMDNKIIRWDIEKFPIKINIVNETSNTLPDYYNIEINKAFSQWQTSVDILSFEISDKNPNIIVKISETPKNICDIGECRFVVGYTEPQINGDNLKSMTITLYNKDPYGNYFSDKELYNTILHEIGHALGIMGHSYSSEDIMYMSTKGNNSIYSPFRSSFQYLSTKDINTIKLLYKLYPDITNTDGISTKGLVYPPIILGTRKDITKRKLKEAQNYIKKAPNLALGYIDAGIAYAELGKENEAIKALTTAFELSKTNNEKYISAFNISTVYFNSKDYDKALTFAEVAQRLSDTDDIKNLIMNIKHAKINSKK